MFDCRIDGRIRMSDMGLEAPDADAAEQDQDAIPVPGDADELDDFPLEVSPADRAEQARELSLDDDEYR
jgi:hypothetical protein